MSLVIAPLAHGQNEYRDHGDRWEGVERRRQVSGERLELIGVVIDHGQTGRRDSNKLGFFLEEDAEVEVNIRAFDMLYRMRPKAGLYHAGFNSFSWPTEITADLGLTVTDVYGLALVSTAEPTRVAPVALSFESPLEPPVTYIFYFVANSITDLTFRVRPSNSDSVIVTEVLKDQPIHQVIEFPWYATSALEPGVYEVSVEATFHYRSRPSVTVNFAWSLFHGL